MERFSLSVALSVHQFSIVWLCPLPHSKCFVIPQLLGNLLRGHVGRFCFLYVVLQITSSFLLFELGQPIDSSNRARISGIQAVGQSHREQHQHFLFPNFLCPFQPEPQITFSELHILIEKLVQFPFQCTHEEFSSQTRIFCISC